MSFDVVTFRFIVFPGPNSDFTVPGVYWLGSNHTDAEMVLTEVVTSRVEKVGDHNLSFLLLPRVVPKLHCHSISVESHQHIGQNRAESTKVRLKFVTASVVDTNGVAKYIEASEEFAESLTAHSFTKRNKSIL